MSAKGFGFGLTILVVTIFVFAKGRNVSPDLSCHPGYHKPEVVKDGIDDYNYTNGDGYILFVSNFCKNMAANQSLQDLVCEKECLLKVLFVHNNNAGLGWNYREFALEDNTVWALTQVIFTDDGGQVSAANIARKTHEQCKNFDDAIEKANQSSCATPEWNALYSCVEKIWTCKA